MKKNRLLKLILIIFLIYLVYYIYFENFKSVEIINDHNSGFTLINGMPGVFHIDRASIFNLINTSNHKLSKEEIESNCITIDTNIKSKLWGVIKTPFNSNEIKVIRESLDKTFDYDTISNSVKRLKEDKFTRKITLEVEIIKCNDENTVKYILGIFFIKYIQKYYYHERRIANWHINFISKFKYGFYINLNWKFDPNALYNESINEITDGETLNMLITDIGPAIYWMSM